MKNLIRKTLLILAATPMVMMASCNDDNNGTKVVEDEREKVILTARLSKFPAEVGTKVSGGANELQLLWQDGDQIGMYYFPEGYPNEYLNNFKTTIAPKAAGNEVASFTTGEDFKWLDEAPVHEFVGIYPYNESSGDDMTAIPVTISNNQPAADNFENFSKNMFMIAKKSTPETSKNAIEMEFSTPLAVLKLVLNPEGSSLSAEKINSIEFNSAKSFVGNGTYNLNNNTFTGFTGKTVKSEFDAPVALSPELATYFYIYPVDLTGDDASVSVKITGEDFIGDFNLFLEDAFTGGEINTIELNIAEMIKNNEGNVEFTGGIPVSEFANSYIVAPGKAIFIPVAKVWDIWTNEFDMNLSESAILASKVLWISTDKGYSEDGTLQVVSITKAKEGKDEAGIYIKTGNLHGNAVVALTLNGQICWSWHIWVTDYDPTTTYKMAAGTKIMDRNLGAMTNEVGVPEANGLYYQWGRKDPFIGSNGKLIEGSATLIYDYLPIYDENGVQLDIEIDGFLFGRTTYTSEMATVMYATQNPTTFLKTATSGFELWSTTSNAGDWKDLINLWSRDAAKDTWDPCPPGWTIAKDTHMVDAMEPEEYVSGAGPNDPNIGYFPAAGFIGTGGNISQYNTSGGTWFAGHNGWGGAALEYTNTSGARNLRYPYDNSSFTPAGFNVRCVEQK